MSKVKTVRIRFYLKGFVFILQYFIPTIEAFRLLIRNIGKVGERHVNGRILPKKICRLTQRGLAQTGKVYVDYALLTGMIALALLGPLHSTKQEIEGVFTCALSPALSGQSDCEDSLVEVSRATSSDRTTTGQESVGHGETQVPTVTDATEQTTTTSASGEHVGAGSSSGGASAEPNQEQAKHGVGSWTTAGKARPGENPVSIEIDTGDGAFAIDPGDPISIPNGEKSDGKDSNSKGPTMW
ncbi:MAG: hypothetical protein KDD66_08015 [Bdellovibrionales bacterium]|nr:hypothetical protein [Bdellovibrionales bacterium]